MEDDRIPVSKRQECKTDFFYRTDLCAWITTSSNFDNGCFSNDSSITEYR